MSDPNDPRYDQARRRFDELDVEEQACFLVEATATTLARGVEQAGELLATGLEDVLRQAKQRTSARDRESPGAAEPETAQRRTPRSGERKSDSSS